MKQNLFPINTKLLVCVLTLLGASSISFAQSFDHVWAQQAGGEKGAEIVVDGVVDQSDNVYVLGSFASQTVSFGSTVLTNRGQIDIFLVKYAPNGNVLWAKSYGNVYEDVPTAIALDQNGSLTITGHFSSQSLKFGTTTLNTHGAKDIFIAQLDSNGVVLWAKGFGGNLDEVAHDIAVDQNNSIYITGHFSSNSISFGTHSITKSVALSDIYIAGFDDSGNSIWAIASSGTNVMSNATANVLLIDNQNNILVGGRIGSEGDNSKFLVFGSDTLWTVIDQWGYAKVSAYLAKFTKTGTFINGSIDSVYYETVCMANDVNDNYYLGLSRLASVVIGAPTGDFSIVKMNTSLQNKWRKEFTSHEGINVCKSIAVHKNYVYATGHYVGRQTNFETDTFYTSSYLDRVYADVFMVKYDTNGREIWVESYGDKITDEGKVVIPFSDNEFYLLGNYESSTFAIDDHTLTNQSDTGSYHVHVSPDWHWRHSNIFVTQVSDKSSGVKRISKSTTLIYPNPSSGLITIKGEDKILHIEISNSVGQTVLRINDVNRYQTRVQLNAKPKGIYFIKVTTKTSYSLSKMIIE